MNPPTYVKGSLLAYAENVDIGFHVIVIHDDTEDAPCNWGKGYIIRIQNDITIILYQATLNRFFMNQRPAAKDWLGWDSFIRNSDFKLDTYTAPKPENNNIFTLDNTFSVDIIKSGHVVILKININGSIVATINMETLLTIPEKYRPPINLIHNYVNQQGDAMLLEIMHTGQMQFSNLGKATDGWICRQIITYVVDK